MRSYNISPKKAFKILNFSTIPSKMLSISTPYATQTIDSNISNKHAQEHKKKLMEKTFQFYRLFIQYNVFAFQIFQRKFFVKFFFLRCVPTKEFSSSIFNQIIQPLQTVFEHSSYPLLFSFFLFFFRKIEYVAE